MIYFLSGLPRTGSTLLGALLSQRNDIHVTATSALIDMLGGIVQNLENAPEHERNNKKIHDLLRLIVDYEIKECGKGNLINKSRGWPAPVIIKTMTQILNVPVKIIATVRPIRECLTSAIKISKWSGSVKNFIKESPLVAHIFNSYHTLKAGYEAYPDYFLFVEYDNLVNNPQNECDKIADFLNLPRFEHKLTGLINPVPENDEKTWNLPGLHDIRPIINKKSDDPLKVLGNHFYHYYDGGFFWNPVKTTKVIEKHVLDIQLEAGWNGDFDLGEMIADLAQPDDDRAMYNSGFYFLRRGKLLEGMQRMEYGFNVNVFGSSCGSGQPRWQGEPLDGKVVLLHLEGGQGDQIWGARWVKDLENRGAKVIVSGGSPELAELFHDNNIGAAFIEHKAAGGVFHNYYAPSMRIIPALGYEYSDINGTPYFNRYPLHKRNGKLRVGIRWEGNPKFEHEQKRTQEPQWMFSLNKYNMQLVNLQKDTEIEIPDYIETPRLSNWRDTQRVLSTLDLVISSCTSVPHLAAAMGIPTWIIVPILPYFLWAQDIDTAPWYNSVRIFRQRKKDNWNEPHQLVEQALAYEINKIRNGNDNYIVG